RATTVAIECSKPVTFLCCATATLTGGGGMARSRGVDEPARTYQARAAAIRSSTPATTILPRSARAFDCAGKPSSESPGKRLEGRIFIAHHPLRNTLRPLAGRPHDPGVASPASPKHGNANPRACGPPLRLFITISFVP